MAIFQLQFCSFFLSSVFDGIAQRVMSLYTCLAVVGLFVFCFVLSFFFFYSFVKRETELNLRPFLT